MIHEVIPLPVGLASNLICQIGVVSIINLLQNYFSVGYSIVHAIWFVIKGEFIGILSSSTERHVAPCSIIVMLILQIACHPIIHRHLVNMIMILIMHLILSTHPRVVIIVHFFAIILIFIVRVCIITVIRRVLRGLVAERIVRAVILLSLHIVRIMGNLKARFVYSRAIQRCSISSISVVLG